MPADLRSIVPGLGFEPSTPSTLGRVATWIVFVVMCVGAWGSVAFEAGYLLTAAEGVEAYMKLTRMIDRNLAEWIANNTKVTTLLATRP